MKYLYAIIGLGMVAGAVAIIVMYRHAVPEHGSLSVHEPTLTWPPSTSASPHPRTARFSITNTGGRPVRVLSIESGCGCAKPVVEPATIEPGKTGHVHVDPTTISVIAGDRIIPIALYTDSPITPRVDLYLKLEDTRRPPFVYGFTGDLAYRDPIIPDVREIRMNTVEFLGENHTPTVYSDLSFLRFELTSIKDKEHPKQRNAVVRSYTFTASFASPPPRESFQGTVSSRDPFHPERILTLNVFGEVTPPVRVAPARAILRISNRLNNAPEAQFIILSKDPLPDLRITTESDNPSPLVIEVAKSHSPENQAMFTVRYQPTSSATVEGIHNILVWTTRLKGKPIVVPILVQLVEDEPK